MRQPAREEPGLSMMNTSTFGWLDYDDGERRRMMELIDVFREKGTVDELGLGGIRDTFSDHFFPGTSTIQTRARYFLFVPWLYRQIEEERVPSNRAAARARELQWKLVQSLKAGSVGGGKGVIGYEAGENLQRLPSSIYWIGLRQWGIRRFDGSIEQYHASLDEWYRAMRIPRSSEGGELLLPGAHNWRETLPPPPGDLFETTDFTIRREEAEFLVERIYQDCPNTLLATLFTRGISRIRSSSFPWQLGGLDGLDPDLQRDIEDARRFSLGMEGATLLYNLMLAERQVEQGLVSDPGRVERYQDAFSRWADEMTGDKDALGAWDRIAMWDRIRRINPRIRPGAERFSEAWLTRAVADPHSAGHDLQMRALIQSRERVLKGSLARLSNPRALEKWGGASGLGRLAYRWGNAKRTVVDILDGLKQPPEVA
jgi:hypothetical protein